VLVLFERESSLWLWDCGSGPAMTAEADMGLVVLAMTRLCCLWHSDEVESVGLIRMRVFFVVMEL